MIVDQTNAMATHVAEPAFYLIKNLPSRIGITLEKIASKSNHLLHFSEWRTFENSSTRVEFFKYAC